MTTLVAGATVAVAWGEPPRGTSLTITLHVEAWAPSVGDAQRLGVLAERLLVATYDHRRIASDTLDLERLARRVRWELRAPLRTAGFRLRRVEIAEAPLWRAVEDPDGA